MSHSQEPPSGVVHVSGGRDVAIDVLCGPPQEPKSGPVPGPDGWNVVVSVEKGRDGRATATIVDPAKG